MSKRVKATIKFKMPEEWVVTSHPVGAAIQGLYTELAKAYAAADGAYTPGEHWSEWTETYKDVED